MRAPPGRGDTEDPASTAHVTDDGVGTVFGRKRREERRFDREATRYQMRQRMLSIGDDYEIENERGERVFKLDGKALRIRKTIRF